MKKDSSKQPIPVLDPQLEEMLLYLSKRRLASAVSGASLIEKARFISEELKKDDIEKRTERLEAQVSRDLDATTVEEMRSLYED